MTDGFLLIDKPEGPTSHGVVDMVRRALGMRRVGHAGTLDPFASGLLIVLLGRATRLARFVVGLDKSYTGTIVLGLQTATDDRTGTAISRRDGWRNLTDEQIAAAMSRFVGEISQLPPAFSAKKVRGERAHRVARRGGTPDLQPQLVTVHRFALVGRREERITFNAEVGSGTYLRSLARQVGAALGCGAHLDTLRRTQIGPFHVRRAKAPDAVAAADLLPSHELLQHLPTLELTDVLRDRVAHGQPLTVPGSTPETVVLLSQGHLVAVAEREGDLLKPRVVLEG